MKEGLCQGGLDLGLGSRWRKIHSLIIHSFIVHSPRLNNGDSGKSKQVQCPVSCGFLSNRVFFVSKQLITCMGWIITT